MSKWTKFSLTWYQDQIPDLRTQIGHIIKNKYDSVATLICNPSFPREFYAEPLRTDHLNFSRSDLILNSPEWINHVIAKIAENIDLDSPDEGVRMRSEKTLMQEQAFADHLIQTGWTLLRLNGGRNTNLARFATANLKGYLLVEVPMADPRLATVAWRRDKAVDEVEAEDTWHWWNRFRLDADNNYKIRLALEMSDDVPSEEELNRWLGEPLESVIIPARLFVMNRNNLPLLPAEHLRIFQRLMRVANNVMIKAHGEDPRLVNIAEYIRLEIDRLSKVTDMMVGFDDVLEIPLQPLYDNLDNYTYEVFERDPVKYRIYQDAIEAALVAKVPPEERDARKLIVMVVGAGRGPLVRAALNASVKSGVRIKIYIIEKNPNAIVALSALLKEMWADRDIELFSRDMRDFAPLEKADLLVSELLGSFGDNELAPECLDGAQLHLKPDGVSIPRSSTSFINPIMSTKLFNGVRAIERIYHPRDKNSTVYSNMECSYVVYPKNVYHIADPQPVFEFHHPNGDTVPNNSRFATLRFKAELDCILHGFIGYFESQLFGNIRLSIHPFTHTRGLSSWFSIYFPITEPQQVKAGDTIEANIWRCVSDHKVWYEWSVSQPQRSHIHNHGGRFCPIYK